ncbi:MAG: hypothetical protein JSR27_04620 [Proteobacteria bacterium]|nr:hypothetical protein [Pseudomonadota bacterium]
MAEPFKEFAKAYVRYSYSHKPVKYLSVTLQALRCMEAALLDACGSADIVMLSLAVMDVSAAKCREFYSSAEVQCNTGRKIQAICDFVREKQLVPSLPVWKSPFKKPAILTEDLGEAGQAHRAKKLPSNETMLAVADLFARADDPESRFFSSILILLMATPSRISEVLKLPVDCIQWEPDEQGKPQMYLRWRAAKGKGAMKKWVVPAMHDVVQEAVRRLLEIGEPARVAARFAFDNPGIFMRHPGCLADPEKDGERPLMPDEFCAAVGVKCPRGGRRLDGSPTWVQAVVDKRLGQLIEAGATSYRDLAGYVLETCSGPHWPFISDDRTVEAWAALCLHRWHELHKESTIKHFSWRLLTTNEVNARMGPEKGLSLFDRFGLKNPDGSSIKLTTHQLRHWLSTMSERAGMDDYTLAQWAGRARVADNRHYDHRSPEEQLDAAKQILQMEQPSLLERIKHRQPVTYKELGVDRLGTAKATLYGMCVHDYAMAPCQKQRECMTCKEHVCIKGDHVTLDRIRLLEAQTELLLKQAEKAHEDGDFGADRWVDNHRWKLAHVTAMRVALEHPSVSDGKALRIPDGHDPSAVRRALMDLGLVDAPTIEAVAPQAVPALSD